MVFALLISLIITLIPTTISTLLTTSASPASSHTEIDVATAWNMMSSGLYPNLVILDVRNQSEFDTGYISRAILIPVWQLPQRIGELTSYNNTEILVYCRTGGRSHNASLILDVNNFTKVYDMLGGINAWNSSGYPIVNPPTPASGNWTLVTDARAMKAYPDLKEYVYQKNATMPPNGQYDKIGLHRLVKLGTFTKGAVFIDPGIYGSGEQLISNPPESNYTADENSSQAIYWANRGFEVYSIDWRAHFLPSTMNVSQASTIAGNWGWDQYINDMKEAVDKAKDLSGNSKIFLAGLSLGGQVAMYYASEYWKQDLKGIIILDGTENPVKVANVTNTYNVTLALSSLAKIGGLVWETPRRSSTDIPPSGMLFAYQNALQNPGAPAEWPPGTPLQPTINPLTNKTWSNITEYIAYQMYSTNYSNIYDGYGNIAAIVNLRACGDRYFPMRPLIEGIAIHDWNNCPYVSYDFDDHYKEIDVPIFVVRSGLWGIPTYGNFTNGTATSDFNQITLPKYGHLDVFTGTYSARDVSEPTCQWILNHLPPTLFGNTIIGSVYDQNDAQAKSASYFMCNQTGKITDIFAFVARVGAAGDGAAAIYADNGGLPGALIAATDEATVGTSYSWVDFHLPSPVIVTSGTGYWLAISSNNALNLNIEVGSGVRIHNGVSSWFSDPFGPVWVTDTTGAMSIYASGVPMQTSSPTLTTQEQVRDAAMSYIKSRHPETAKFMTNLDWTGGRATPPNLIGAETYMYYSQGWNVTINYPVYPNPIYKITADYSAIGISIPYRIIWKGTMQNELVNETSYVFAQ